MSDNPITPELKEALDLYLTGLTRIAAAGIQALIDTHAPGADVQITINFQVLEPGEPTKHPLPKTIGPN